MDRLRACPTDPPDEWSHRRGPRGSLLSIYVDPSAFSKRYVSESETETVRSLLDAEPHWVTCRHSFVEMHRALTRSVPESFRQRAVASFRIEWRRFQVVEIDEETCERASELVITLGVKTLDALHLAAANRVGGGALPFLTCDLRQAQAARSLGWTVLGV